MTTQLALANESDECVLDLLCFDIGNERFAVQLSAVDEVIDAKDLHVHLDHGSRRGVIRLGTELLAVYDAESLLCARSKSIDPMAIVFSNGNTRVAILVDQADAISGVSLNSLRSPVKIVSRDRVLVGALRVGSRWVGLLEACELVQALDSPSQLETSVDR